MSFVILTTDDTSVFTACGAKFGMYLYIIDFAYGSWVMCSLIERRVTFLQKISLKPST